MSYQAQVETEPLFFQTRLHTLVEANLALLLPQLLDSSFDHPLSPAQAQLKKEARLELSLRHTSESVGFLHAALIEIDGKNYLLAGGSGVGKSTYSQELLDHFGGQVLAKDWVALEKEEGEFFASDLNFPDNLKHPDRCRLDGVIFLTKYDDLDRDAYVPNQEEKLELLRQTFDTADQEELEILSQFWLSNWENLPNVLAVPTRERSLAYTKETLINLVERQKMKLNKVGVIGLGAIGAELANQLGQLANVDQVNLFNRSADKAVGYALDMNHGVAEKGEVFVAHQDAAQVFANSDVVFLCFREQNPLPVAANGDTANLPERWGKAAVHAAAMEHYARLASEQNFQGTIFVISNPVDVLSFALYSQSQQADHPLRTYQIYGIGLELDKARALYYAQQEGLALDPTELKVFGNHADEFILQSPLSPADSDRLQQLVAGASPTIRQHVPRTIYGPVGAAKQALVALQENRGSTLTLIQEGSYIGRPLEFRGGLPMFGDQTEAEVIREILAKNKKSAPNYITSKPDYCRSAGPN